MGTAIAIIMIILIVFLLYKNALMSFKIGYYEQTLKNYKNVFSDQKWENIEIVMNKKNPFN